VSRNRLVYLAALLALTAAAVVHYTLAVPASSEASQLEAERSRLESEIAQMRAELSRLEGTEPPSLPRLSELHGRIAEIAALLPTNPGYALKVSAPQPFPGQGEAVATQVRVAVAFEATYDTAVEVLRELASIPKAGLGTVSVTRAADRPGRVRVSAEMVLVFESGGAAGAGAAPPPGTSPGQPRRTTGEEGSGTP
jgi:hypothetical protein